MVLLVELTLEAMQDVPDLGEPRFLERAPGVERAITATADEDDGAIDARRLLHVRDEVGIHFPVRTVVPRHQDRAGRVPHEQVLHLAAAVDEDRIGILLEKRISLSRLEVLHHALARLLKGAELYPGVHLA